MNRLIHQLSSYSFSHQNKINRIIHYIGIPCVVFSLLILLGWVHIVVPPDHFSITFAWLALACVLVYYVFLDIMLGVIMALIMLPITFLASLIADHGPFSWGGELFLILFIGGWILQLIGHLFERKKPAFMRNIAQLLIGPIFLLTELLFALGYRHTLQQKIKEYSSRYRFD